MPISQTGARMDTEADDYLNEWREVPLTSVADIRFSSVNKVSQPGEEPVRLCNYTDVYKNDYVTADMDFMRATATKSEIERFGLQVGDVIITKDSETPDDIGIPTVVDTTAPDLVCGYHLALLRPNQDEVDPTFLAKQLAHHRIARYFGQQANGTTRYGLSTAAISNAPLHLPRPESQRSASALMRMVDAQISQTETVIAKLKQVRAGMLHDLLSYGLDEHGQLRDPIAHPEQFKDSPLGLIPRAWDVGTVKSLAINRDSKRIPVKQADRESRHGLYPYYGASGIIDYIDGFIFEGDFVLIGEDGENLRSRQLPLAFIATGKFWVNNHAHILEPLPETDVRFLATILENQDFIPWLLGSAQPKLTQRNLEIVPLRIPLPDEQKRISDSLEKCDIEINAEIIELEKLKSLKSGLQDDLLIGRVRVPETIMEGAENA